MENLKLENGKILNRLYGKYNPNLTLISLSEISEIHDLGAVKSIPILLGIEINGKFYEGFESTGRRIIIDLKMSKSLANYLTIDYKETNDIIYVSGVNLRHKRESKVSYYLESDQTFDRVLDVEFKVINEKQHSVYNGKMISITDGYKQYFEILNMDIPPHSGNIYNPIEGEFRTNKKGTKIFDTTGKKDHVLLILKLDRRNNAHGFEIDKINNYLYHHTARSNGGGVGYDYVIVSKDYKNQLSEDDF